MTNINNSDINHRDWEDIVNSRSDRKSAELAEIAAYLDQKKRESYVATFANAASKSVQNLYYEEEVVKRKRQIEINKEINRKIVAILLASSLAVGVGAGFAGKIINDNAKINTVIDYEGRNLKGFINYANSLGSSDPYSKINKDDIITVYVLKRILSPQEFDKFIKKQKFIVPDSGEEKYYINFAHYLWINGYKNESAFNSAAKEAIIVFHDSGEFRDVYPGNYYSTIDVNVDTTTPASRRGR